VQFSSVKPGRQTHDGVFSKRFTIQVAPFLQRFRSDSEQDLAADVVSAIVTPVVTGVVVVSALVIEVEVVSPVVTGDIVVAAVNRVSVV